MTRTETIVKLKEKKATIEKHMDQVLDLWGPYITGPGREQLISWQLTVDEINADLERMAAR